uniref:Uncharacterized protein n=1 Tax=Opuntia streptacantha TaxID=393608 RepID=A0A7C9D1P6_OPUST
MKLCTQRVLMGCHALDLTTALRSSQQRSSWAGSWVYGSNIGRPIMQPFELLFESTGPPALCPSSELVVFGFVVGVEPNLLGFVPLEDGFCPLIFFLLRVPIVPLRNYKHHSLQLNDLS